MGNSFDITIIVQRMEIGGYKRVSGVGDPEQTRAFLGGLTPSQEYRVYVKAYTEAGAGEADYLDAKTASPARKLRLFDHIKE